MKINVVAPSLLKACIPIAMKTKRMLYISGPPGIGKSAMVAQAAKTYNMKLIDIRLSQLDSCDLNGFPTIGDQKATYTPMAMFPLETDPLPIDENGKEMAGWFLFMDEFNAGERPTQKAAYKVSLDKMHGDHKIHNRCLIIGAGNREEDNALVEEMGSATQTRMIHLELVSTPPEWLIYANKMKFDYRVTTYLQQNPMKLNTFDPNVETQEHTFPCERTWHFVSDLLKHCEIDSPEAKALIAGAIGSGPALEFLNWTAVFDKLPSIEEITTSPTTALLPEETGALFSLAGMLSSHATLTNLDALVTYMGRTPLEYQVVCFKYMNARDSSLFLQPILATWLIEHGERIF
jgi:hypothetical protein